MSRNTVHKVTAKDTTESSKKADSKGGKASEVRAGIAAGLTGGWRDAKRAIKDAVIRAASHTDRELARGERDMARAADSGVPVVSQLAKVAQPVSVGARAALANLASGGGKNYTPELRDERYFSEDALRELARNIDQSGGRGTTRYRYTGLFGGNGMAGSAGAIEASQTVGGSTIRGGKLTDVFDIDTKDPYGANQAAHAVHPLWGATVDAANKALGKVFGSETDPDAGKVRTEIPMEVLNRYRNTGMQQDSKGGEVRAATEGGDTGEEVPDETASEEMVQEPAQEVSDSGPRIAVNPAVFKDKRDALCVAYNEAYRVVMEMNGFDPVSEPTDRQREFFSDTAYADDENMLRRTILARICTFDTSVGDPTDEQLEEAVEFLETVMEIGAPQDEREQSIVQRTHDILKAAVGMPRKEKEPENPAPSQGGTNEDAGGGDADEDDLFREETEEEKKAMEDLDKALAEGGPNDRYALEATGGPVEQGGTELDRVTPAEETKAEGQSQEAQDAEPPPPGTVEPAPVTDAEKEGAAKAEAIAKGMKEMADEGAEINDVTYDMVKNDVEVDRGEALPYGDDEDVTVGDDSAMRDSRFRDASYENPQRKASTAPGEAEVRDPTSLQERESAKEQRRILLENEQQDE